MESLSQCVPLKHFTGFQHILAFKYSVWQINVILIELIGSGKGVRIWWPPRDLPLHCTVPPSKR